MTKSRVVGREMSFVEVSLNDLMRCLVNASTNYDEPRILVIACEDGIKVSSPEGDDLLGEVEGHGTPS